MFRRSLRGQLLPVFTVLAVCAAAFLLPYGLLERAAGACMQALSQAEEGTPANAVHVLLGGLWLVLTGALGLRVLAAMAALIERGWLSELSLASAANLALLAIWLVVAQVPELSVLPLDQQPLWWSWMTLPWLGLTAAAYALALGRAPAQAAPGPALPARLHRPARRHGLRDQAPGCRRPATPRGGPG